MSKTGKIVITIFFFSLVLHSIYVLIAPQIDPVISNDPLYGDSYGYNLLANNILSKKMFSWDGVVSTSYRAPGYPVFLATIYTLSGQNLIIVRLIQALLAALICVPVFWIGYRLAGLRLAIMASLGTAFHPLLLYITAWIYTEVLFIFLLWLGLWFLFLIFRSDENRYIWLAGIILGIATMVRPQFIMLPLGCLILGLLARWDRRIIHSFGLVQLILLMVVMPWTVRNYSVHQEMVLISTDTGPNLYGANNPASNGGFASQSWSLPGFTEVEADKEYTSRALSWIVQNPNKFFALVPAKLRRFYSPLDTTTAERSLGRMEPLINLIYGIFLFFAFIGSIWLTIIHKKREPLVIVALIIYATMITIIFHGGARLALPIAPALIISSGYMLIQGASLIHRLHSKRPSMARENLKSFFSGLMAILVMGSIFSMAPTVRAQSLQYWTEPVNLSQSGSTTDPELVIDSDGVMWATWADTADERYKFVKSEDGKTWTEPSYADFPFSEEDDARPSFYAAPNRTIYIAWRDKGNTLFVAQAQSRYLTTSNSWRVIGVIAYSTVVAYDAVIDSKGVLHVAYVSQGGASTPAGVFYSQVSGGGITKAVNLYLSPYFRSASPESAHVRVAVADKEGAQQVYAAWDDRAQKRIFLAKSSDGGKNWGEAAEMVGPEAVTGISMPFNVDLGVSGDNVLMMWQIGQPDAQCTQYSAWSTDGGTEFGLPVKVSEATALCGQPSEFLQVKENYSLVWFNVMDDLSMAAWNGTGWSEARSQNEIAAFTNPMTLDSVIFGCQKTLVYQESLYVIGCDRGVGGDAWLSARSLGGYDEWFPPSASWEAPVEITNVDQTIGELSAVADSKNNIQAFWIQNPAPGASESLATIQHAQSNGKGWSRPMPIFSQQDGTPIQLDVQVDNQDRLMLAWVDSRTGDVFFNWAGADRSKSPAEWQEALYVPSPSETNSSPDILADQAGTVIVAYAVPINDKRGIYFVESGDGGETWTGPLTIFDAAAAGWEIVDEPQIGLSGDGRLHVLFKQYTLHGEERIPTGLYYSQSADGGLTWSEPEVVSQSPAGWSEITGHGPSTVHRLWQEQQEESLTTFHQISEDGGVTWSRASIVSSNGSPSSLTVQAMDPAGNIHVFQTESQQSPVILDQMWNGTAWIPQLSKEIYVQDRNRVTSMAAAVTTNGTMLAAVVLDYPFSTEGPTNNIISVGRALEATNSLSTPYPAMIPVIHTTAQTAQEFAGEMVTATAEVSRQDLYDSPFFLAGKKNLVGGILIGGIILILVMVFLPIRKWRKKQKSGPEKSKLDK